MTIRGRGADAVTRSESLGPEDCSVQHVLCPLVVQRELVRFLLHHLSPVSNRLRGARERRLPLNR